MKIFPSFLGILLVAAGITAAVAQPRPAAPRPSPASITAGVQEHTLPNGLRILTKEVHSAPVVNFSVWYRVGSRNEHEGITGSSHLLEHMMFKGTKKYGLGDISRLLFINGANFNAATAYDWTQYYETLSSDRLELAVQLEADRMVNSRVDASDLNSEMTVVRSELEGRENSPDELLYQAIAATAIQAHPYHWPIIGWRSDVENVPRSAVYHYYKTHYGPNNATVVMVGDFKTEQALALVKKYFAALPKIPTPGPVYTQEPPQRGEKRVIVRRSGALPKVALAYKVPPARHPDTYALDALTSILGEGRSSRLYQDLVEKQIAVDADAGSAFNSRDPFLWLVNATGAQGVTAERLESALDAEIERLKTEPVTQEELDRAKNRIEAAQIYRNDSVTAQAQTLGEWASIGDWHYLGTYLQRIRALTPADLQRVAQKYFKKETRTVGTFIPTMEGGPAGPPPKEGAARVDKPKKGARPIPIPKPAKTVAQPRKISRFKLANGISVVVQENHTTPTFSLMGSLDAGGVLDPRDKNGLSQLTAAMLTRGTEAHNALQFATELESVGASLGASADSLTTNLSGRALTKDFDREINLLAEMLRQPTFPDQQLQRLKAQFAAGLEESKTDPGSLAGIAFQRAVFPEGNPLRPPTIDEQIQQLQTISREDVEGFYRKQYGPDHMILVIVGDVSAAGVRQALESRLGSWPRNPGAAPIPKIPVPLQARATKEVIPVPDRSQSSIIWGFAGGLKRSDPDFYAAQVMNMVVGGGGALNSRLGNTIRDEQGLAYDVESAFDSSLYPGPFEVTMGTNPANAERAARSLQKEITAVMKSGLTQREVDEAVAYLTGRFPLRLETNGGLAQILWMAEFYNLGPSYIDKYASYYRAVTLPQVNKALKTHLHPDRATLVIAGPPTGK